MKIYRISYDKTKLLAALNLIQSKKPLSPEQIAELNSVYESAKNIIQNSINQLTNDWQIYIQYEKKYGSQMYNRSGILDPSIINGGNAPTKVIPHPKYNGQEAIQVSSSLYGLLQWRTIVKQVGVDLQNLSSNQDIIIKEFLNNFNRLGMLIKL